MCLRYYIHSLGTFIHTFLKVLEKTLIYNFLSHTVHFIHITIISHSSMCPSQKDTLTHFQINLKLSCNTPENTEMWNFNLDQSRRRNCFHPQRRVCICLQGSSLPLIAQIKGKRQCEHCSLFKTAIK